MEHIRQHIARENLGVVTDFTYRSTPNGVLVTFEHDGIIQVAFIRFGTSNGVPYTVWQKSCGE